MLFLLMRHPRGRGEVGAKNENGLDILPRNIRYLAIQLRLSQFSNNCILSKAQMGFAAAVNSYASVIIDNSVLNLACIWGYKAHSFD